MMACGAMRNSVVRESTDLRTTELRSTEARDSVRLELRDTLREVTTITITKNAEGDTIMQSIVTERDRIRNRDRARDNHERTVIRTDTVFIERRDSIYARNYGPTESRSRASPVVTGLKWIFWIIIALIALKICPFFRRE